MSAECLPSVADGNAGLAFGIVTAAGLSTTLGAALAFVMPYSRSAKNLFLAACLAIAAGVMIYVSFVEIFAAKAIVEFEKCVDSRFAYLYATLCFFGGVAITYAFDKALHLIEHLLCKRKSKKAATGVLDSKQFSNSSSDIMTPTPANQISNPAEPSSVHHPQSTSHQQQAQQQQQQTPNESCSPCDSPSLPNLGEPLEIDGEVGHDGHLVAALYNDHAQDSKALIRMGIFAGIALAFHNFPEGLATFVAVLEDASVGASVAIAIGIHNIPEGICVAMPIYYATGSRTKAFVWATLSGMTELIGALLGWVVLRRVITPVVYGVLFGVVAGMMVYISLKELLPTAHRYDPEDKVTTMCLLAGMVVMALSLVLFLF